MKKKSFFKSPLVILAFVCFALAAITPFLFQIQSANVKGISKKNAPTATFTSTPLRPTGFEGQAETVSQGAVYKVTSTPTVIVQPTQKSSNQTANPTSTTQANKSSETIDVSLSINGSYVGNVSVKKDGNQCEVLTSAKDQGKISSLLMKYDNSLGTNGVYQINGVGKENSIWWVYKVNGKSATQGCSYVKANSGDSVVWEYVGS